MPAEISLMARISFADVSGFRPLPGSLASSAVASGHADAFDISLGWKRILRLLYAARRAGFDPHLTRPAMPHVQPPVGHCVDASQVVQAVVVSDPVHMVDLMARWDRAVRIFPHTAVLTDDRAIRQFDLRIPIAADPSCLSVFLSHAGEIGPGQPFRSSKWIFFC